MNDKCVCVGVVCRSCAYGCVCDSYGSVTLLSVVIWTCECIHCSIYELA